MSTSIFLMRTRVGELFETSFAVMSPKDLSCVGKVYVSEKAYNVLISYVMLCYHTCVALHGVGIVYTFGMAGHLRRPHRCS